MTTKLTFKENNSRLAVLPIVARAAIGLLPLVSALPLVAQNAQSTGYSELKDTTNKKMTSSAAALRASLAKSNANDTLKGDPALITETKTVNVGSDAGPFGKITKIDAKGVEFLQTCTTDPDWDTVAIKSGKMKTETVPWRLDYGQSRRIGEYVLQTSITVEKGAKPGTAITKISHQKFSEDYKAYCSAVSGKTVKAGSAVDYLGKALMIDATGVEFSGGEIGGEKPLRLEYDKPQAYTFGFLSQSLTITVKKGTAPGTAVVTFSP